MEIVSIMHEATSDGKTPSFYGLVYERVSDEEYVVVYYEGRLLSINDIGFDSTFRLRAEEKHICIKNAADIENAPEEVDQLEAFANFLDPRDRVVDEVWMLLEDWEPQELTIPVKYLDTYGMIGGPEHYPET